MVPNCLRSAEGGASERILVLATALDRRMAGAAEEYAAECAWALAVLDAGFWSWRICEMPDGLLMLMLELRWARVWMAPPGAGASLVRRKVRNLCGLTLVDPQQCCDQR